ncbi:MAG: NPCBM/NEW2 domain-containing protein [Polyangiaceae bacterium]
MKLRGRACQGLLLLALACRVQVSVGEVAAAGGAAAGGGALASAGGMASAGAAVNGGTAASGGAIANGGATASGGTTASGGAASVPACVEPAGNLLNGGFEDGSGALPQAWLLDGDPAAVRRVSAGAHSGAYAFAISNGADTALAASVRQKVSLAPYTPYVLRAWMRVEGARDLGAPRFFAEISAEPYFLASAGPASAAVAAAEWQLIELDFETGYDGNIEVSGRSNGAGNVYFDDFSISCNTALKRYQSAHFILDVRPEQEQAATPAAIAGVVERTERVIQAVAQLTGQAAALQGHRQAAWGPDWYARLGWPVDEPGGAGYPFLWSATSEMLSQAWRRNDYVPESFVRAIAQNFASPAWDFELPGIPEAHDTSGLIAYHAYQSLELASVYPLTRLAAHNRDRFVDAYSSYWAKRRCARSDALAYRDMLLADRVGWQPFEQAYRSLSSAPELRTPWSRVQAFHQVVASQSGRALYGSDDDEAQGRALFTATEWNDVQRYYDRSLSGDFPAPALLDSAVRQLPLSLATWESAATDWAQPARNTLADGCPLATESTTYAHGLWAHAASSYVFDLGGRWQSLDADFGLALGVFGGSVRFQVLGDGHLLFASETVSDGRSRQLSVPLAGVQRLELRTETPPAADGHVDETSAWGVWLEPTLVR